MKVDYLKDGSPDCPIVRLYNFTPEEARRLRDACRALHAGEIDRFDLYAQPWVESVNGFRLSLGVASWNRGLEEQRDGSFIWLLRQTWWDQVDALIDPFVEDHTDGFQWLDGSCGTGLLLSYHGCW